MTSADESNAYKKACGERLKQVREALGFDTRRAFAAALPDEVSEDRVEKWEAGAVNMPPYYANFLKNRWGIPTDWIYAGDPSRIPNDTYQNLIKLFPRLAS